VKHRNQLYVESRAGGKRESNQEQARNRSDRGKGFFEGQRGRGERKDGGSRGGREEETTIRGNSG